jgi:hypothetical protein
MINQIVNDLFLLAEFALIRSTNVNSLTELNRGAQHWFPPCHVAARNEIAFFSKLHYCTKSAKSVVLARGSPLFPQRSSTV